ncbi:hypothetical protein GY14_30285 [Delftia tsuruhatensis]|nr:hypothetical protein GY14_30285 [Delftia tsuruhatensis]
MSGQAGGQQCGRLDEVLLGLLRTKTISVQQLPFVKGQGAFPRAPLPRENVQDVDILNCQAAS